MRNVVTAIALVSSLSQIGSADASQATVVDCQFERLPPIVMVFQGGMGASDNTVQIGQAAPVPLSVGSSLMTAQYGAQELTFSLRLPNSVTITAPGNDDQTFYGDCINRD